MGKQDFLQDLLSAARLVRPTVEADSPKASVGTMALAKSALWLTPRVVEAYDPADFGDVPQNEQDELRRAVDEFRSIAQSVPPDESASDDVLRRGLDGLHRIIARLRPIVLDEWTTAVGQLIRDAESWCSQKNWPSRRREKELDEPLLGTYSVPQLRMEVDERLILQLDPVARFVRGALGLVDFSIVPSYETVTIPRTADGWQVHLDIGKTYSTAKRIAWSEAAFFEAVAWLKERG